MQGKFDEGDLIAVFGGELGKDTHVADTVTLCKVLIVGQTDLVVERSEHYTSSCHIVPKSICTKLCLSPEILSSAAVLSPQVGDLVVSFTRGYKAAGSDKTSGIIFKIIYRLGKADKCMLLSGTEMISVDADDLIVLHRPKE